MTRLIFCSLYSSNKILWSKSFHLQPRGNKRTWIYLPAIKLEKYTNIWNHWCHKLDMERRTLIPEREETKWALWLPWFSARRHILNHRTRKGIPSRSCGLIKLKKQIWEYRKSKGAKIYEEERAQQKNTPGIYESPLSLMNTKVHQLTRLALG